MLKTIQKNIIIRAIQIQMNDGKTPKEILESFTKLTNEDKEVILNEMENRWGIQ